MPQPAIALTRRPVKDKGALMQTLHLWFRALRAISLRQGLSRWRTPSDARRAGMGGAFALPNPPEPTSAVGSRPAMSRQRLARCPTVGAGLPLASPLREVRAVGPGGPETNRVCPRQTASDLSPYPAPHEAGDLGAGHWQARASEVRCTPSPGLSFLLRPQPYAGRAFGKRTADQMAHVRASAKVSSGACWYRLHHRAG